jgi:hypothetical protein
MDVTYTKSNTVRREGKQARYATAMQQAVPRHTRTLSIETCSSCPSHRCAPAAPRALPIITSARTQDTWPRRGARSGGTRARPGSPPRRSSRRPFRRRRSTLRGGILRAMWALRACWRGKRRLEWGVWGWSRLVEERMRGRNRRGSMRLEGERMRARSRLASSTQGLSTQGSSTQARSILGQSGRAQSSVELSRPAWMRSKMRHRLVQSTLAQSTLAQSTRGWSIQAQSRPESSTQAWSILG